MTDDDRDARLAQYLSGYGRKVTPEKLAAIDPNDPNAHLAQYLSGYGRKVTRENDATAKDFKGAMPVCCHRFGTTREIPCLSPARCPHREKDHSRGRERTRECG